MAAGDDSSVPLASPTGNADTRLTANGDQRQVVAIGNAGDVVAGVEPFGSLNVSLGPTTTFYDQWGSSLDTTDRWTVAAGGTPTITAGEMVMPATVSTYNALQSKILVPATLGHQYLAMGYSIEASAAVGAGRFWGLGTYTATPTTTRLVTDGIGFEIDQATGNLLAVTYNTGTRTTVATLTRPTDGLDHRYALYWRVTGAYWYIDNLQVPVASLSWPSVTSQEMPVLIVRQNAASFTGTPVFSNAAVAVGDTSRPTHQISDGTFPFRRARVGKQGGLSIAGAPIASTSGAIAAAATGTVGPVDVSEAGNISVVVKNTVAASAWAGAPVLVFEQSDDNVSWSPLVMVRNDNGATGSTIVLPAGTANASMIFEAPVEAINYVRVRVTTGPTTNGITVVIAAGSLAFQPLAVANLNATPISPLGTTTGTTPVLSGQVGRVVRATANVAQATAATLIAAPAAGTRIYVTNISCTNEGAALTVVRLFAGSLPAAAGAVAVTNDVWDFAIAASGGGAGIPFPPHAPWALPLATALSFAVTVATTWDITVGYYVAP